MTELPPCWLIGDPFLGLDVVGSVVVGQPREALRDFKSESSAQLDLPEPYDAAPCNLQTTKFCGVTFAGWMIEAATKVGAAVTGAPKRSLDARGLSIGKQRE